MSFKAFGVETFRRAIARGIELAELAQAKLANYKCFELTSKARLGIVTFRYVKAGYSLTELNAINRRIIRQCIEDRFAMLSSTELRGARSC